MDEKPVELNMMEAEDDAFEDDEDDDPWGVPGFDPWARKVATSDVSDDDFACAPCDPRLPTLADLKAARRSSQRTWDVRPHNRCRL